MWGDSYESSRILLPDLIRRLGVDDPVAMVPFRNTLLVASARDPAAIARMFASVEAAAESNPRWLSFEPLTLAAADEQWLPAPFPGEIAERVRQLCVHNASRHYSTQKDLLEQQNERNGHDVFVASFQIVHKDNGPRHSMSVWTEGVDAMLPTTEFVALNKPVGGKSQPVLVTWASVVAEAGHLMDDMGLEPPRFRVRQFPEGTAFERLRRKRLGVAY
jgi:hypothetical protein